MKSLILYNIIIFLIFNFVFGELSEDCIKLYSFLENVFDIDFCEQHYYNEYENSFKLNLKKKCIDNDDFCIEIIGSLNFENFPILEELNE
eukprot:jgi/Orpsp1_1/1184904/evm.model.c7180000091454.2